MHNATAQPDPISQVVGHRPGKVIAVHLSYASRAQQRGRTPKSPSYFLKTSSSLTGPGTVSRPQGTELLGFEGEIALVIGTDARNVTPEQAWSHVGWITASNDLALHDLRTADKGSNVRSKGGDGFTPVGPNLISANDVDPARLRITTHLDGELVQDDTTAGMLFDFGLMIADLSRVMTLQRGDVILTGTPAGASVAQPGQTITVDVTSLDNPQISSGQLTTEVTDGPALAQWGNAPYVDDQQRADAWGHNVVPEASQTQGTGLDDDLRERLSNVAVATLSAQLRSRGYNEVSIDGVAPLAPGRHMVGTARTLRYVAHRPDLFKEFGGGYNAQKRAIDSVNPGEILVMEARGHREAGTLGDILALRAQVRGAAGIITDGAVRDAVAVAELGLPVHCAAHHPAVLGRRHVPWDIDTTIVCGGATIQPGDIIVADDDGALVIPPHLVREVLEAAERQEEAEEFIAEMVGEGHSVDGLYPLGPDWKERFEAWRTNRTNTATSSTTTSSTPHNEKD